MKAQFSQKMAGERKAVMQAIATLLGSQVNYTKAPKFAYETSGWSIDRNSYLISPVIDMEGGGPAFHADLMDKLGHQSLTAEQSLQVAVYPDVYDPAHLGNIQALLAGKATLLKHAFGNDTAPIAGLVSKEVTGDILAEYGLDGGFAFSSFPPATSGAVVLAALQLSVRVYAQAASQKQVRTKNVPVDNEKYAMRCFLLRIGMMGSDYAITRRELLHRLPGDSSFKNGSRPNETPTDAGAGSPASAQADAGVGQNSLDEMLADAELLHAINNSLEEPPE